MAKSNLPAEAEREFRRIALEAADGNAAEARRAARSFRQLVQDLVKARQAWLRFQDARRAVLAEIAAAEATMGPLLDGPARSDLRALVERVERETTPNPEG